MVKTIRNIFIFLLLIILSTNLILAFNVTIPSIDTNFIINGWAFNGSDDTFLMNINITGELGDDNDSTYRQTIFSNAPIDEANLIAGYSFNEVISESQFHDFLVQHNALIVGEVEYIEKGQYYGAYFDGINDYGVATDHNDFDIPDLGNFTMCISLNTTYDAPTTRGLIYKYNGGQGFYMTYYSDEAIDCDFRGLTGSTTLSTWPIRTGLNDNLDHVVCCRKTGDTVDLWLDGEQLDTDTGNMGSISNSIDFHIASKSGGIDKFQGTIRQLGLAKEYVSDADIIKMNITKTISNLDEGVILKSFFNHPIETDIEEYFLRIKMINLTDTTTYRIQSYSDYITPNVSSYKDVRLINGDNFIYLNNWIPKDYNLPFRIYDLQGRADSLVSEFVLYESYNDTSIPKVFDCSVNNSDMTCDETVRIQCDVIDENNLQQVDFSINLSYIEPNGRIIKEVANLLPLSDTFYIDRTIVEQFENTVTIDWFQVNATDIIGNSNVTLLDVEINYTCCLENWIPNYYNTSCLINDTYLQTIIYTETKGCGTVKLLPENNGTTINISCNYCVSDIQEEKGLCTYQDSTYIRNVSYIDNLYPFCCGITGLESDCQVDFYPYNESYTEYCTIFNNTMDCDSNTYTEFGFGGDKARWLCYPPVDTDTETHCMSYVRDVHTGVIQTNPNYYTQSEAFISLDNEIEVRTSFEAVGNMVSVYFTKDNIIFDGREYVFGVRCTNEGDFYVYEQLITPEYENVNNPITRLVWIKSNVLGIVLGGLLTTILILIIAGYIRELRNRR